MDLKIYLPIIAILVSLLSLSVSVWNASFSRRTKLSELRTTVLIKMLEVSSRISRINSLVSEIRAHAEKLKDFDTFKNFDSNRFNDAQTKANNIYKRLSSVPVKRSLEMYESLFHELCELNEETIHSEKIAQKSHDLYVKQEQSLPASA